MDTPPRAEDLAILGFVLSKKGQIDVLRYVTSHPGSFFRAVQEGTQVHDGSLSRILMQLEDGGLIEGDIPKGDRTGRAVRYFPKPQRLAFLLASANAALTTPPSERCNTPLHASTTE